MLDNTFHLNATEGLILSEFCSPLHTIMEVVKISINILSTSKGKDFMAATGQRFLHASGRCT
jgi:hypothetical protein